jgi:FkbM family methyltransferase
MKKQRVLPLRVILAFLKLVFTNRFVSPNQSGILNLFGSRFYYGNRGSLHGMFKEIFMEQNYYFEDTNAPITIVDCGSNMGMSLLYFRRKAPHATIIAFEPNPHTFAYLTKNIESNRLAVTAHNVGLASSAGTAILYTDSEDLSSQSASLTKQLTTKKRTLEQVTIKLEPLSTYIKGNVDILKLDIEGAEGEVIEELKESGKLTFVQKIFIEYHYDGVHTNYPLGKLLSILESAQFKYVIESSIKFPFMIPRTAKNFSYKIVAWR